ncbi:hypothetical protein BDR07DRAFT_1383085 [Suillus spraguei]|nr:hypothetical protein BDR07DRAFT_1383085 [Suillus spraguei]
MSPSLVEVFKSPRDPDLLRAIRVHRSYMRLVLRQIRRNRVNNSCYVGRIRKGHIRPIMMPLETCLTAEESGIDIEVAEQLKTDFAFVPPLPAAPGDNLREGPKSISLDDIDVEFARIFVMRKKYRHRARLRLGCRVRWEEVFRRGRAFDFAELHRVGKGLVPAAIEDEIVISVTDHNANEIGRCCVILSFATLAEFCQFFR